MVRFAEPLVVAVSSCSIAVSAIQLQVPRIPFPSVPTNAEPAWRSLDDLPGADETSRTKLERRTKSRLRTRVEDLITSSGKLKAHQRVAGALAASFEAEDFNPVPWFSNNHFQTICGYLARDIPESSYIKNGNIMPFVGAAVGSFLRRNNRAKCNFWDEREEVRTPDGDWFHADYKAAEGSPKGLVILLHGLEANAESALSRGIASAYEDLGMDVVCLNFRGCSGEPNDTLGGYHAGFTGDLKYCLELLKSEFAELPPIYLSGFSLGGNVVLKALGELGLDAVKRYNIKGAAVACPPFDLERDIRFLNKQGFNRAVYANGLLEKFKDKVQDQLETLCNGDESTHRFNFHDTMAASTTQEFDNAFIAPVYGFRDAAEYYEKCSSMFFLEKIAVPTLVIRAKDDPFFDPEAIPQYLTYEEGGRAPVKIVETAHGGHLGYAFQQLDDEAAKPNRSWLPYQLARFLQHVQEDSNQ